MASHDKTTKLKLKDPRNKNIVENALQGGRITLEIVQQAAALVAVPYLSQAAGLVLKIFDIVQAVKDNKTGFQDLATETTNVFSVLLQSYDAHSSADVSSWPPSGLEIVVEELIRTLKEIVQLADQYKLRSVFPRILSSKTDAGKLQGLQRKMQSSLQKFEISSQLTSNARTNRDISLKRQKRVIDELGKRRHPGAGWDSAARSDVPKCLPETREAIVATVIDWLKRGGDLETLLWLYGPAGCGKTTLAQTIAQLCHNSKRLVASFFFSHSAPNRPRKKDEFVVSIAYQLCIAIPEAIEYVAIALNNDPGIFDRDLFRQMRALVVEPLNALLENQDLDTMDPKRWWMLLVDGLDECEGSDSQKEILKVLSMAIHELLFPLRIFVSCRPEHAIRSTITTSGMGLSTVQTIPLDNDYKVTKDIKKFILSRFEKIKLEHPSKNYLAADWPKPEDIESIANRSHGLFIYASLVMKYIESEDDHPQNRLQEFLASTSLASADPNDLPFAQLDGMYAYILSKIPTRNQRKVQDILEWIILDNDSDKSPAFCDSLFDFTHGETVTLLKDLASVIYIPDGTHIIWTDLRFFHASFQDFLQDPSRAGKTAPAFLFNAGYAHARLAGTWIRRFSDSVAHMRPFDSEEQPLDTFISRVLAAILHHCRNTNALSEIAGSLAKFDLDLPLATDLCGPKDAWWRRVFDVLRIAIWIHKQDLPEYKKLYDSYYMQVQATMITEWSQYPPEIQHYIPLLLTFPKDDLFHQDFDVMVRLAPSQDLELLELEDKECRELLSELLAPDQKAPESTSFFQGKNAVAQLAFWLAEIAQLPDFEDKTGAPFEKFFSRSDASVFLVAVLKRAPVDLRLNTLLREQVAPKAAEDLADAIRAYSSRCRDFERIKQLRPQVVKVRAAAGTAAAARRRHVRQPAADVRNHVGLCVGIGVVVAGVVLFWLGR